MDIDKQVEYLKSVAIAGCNVNDHMPNKFIDWITWKLGKKIAHDYMIPYNQKMFGEHLNQLGTYWLEKLPNVSFEEVIKSCIEKRPFGQQPGHSCFLYPKHYGYGELWTRMADNIKGHIEYEKKIKGIDLPSRKVITEDNESYCADTIITTIPWKEISQFIGVDNDIIHKIGTLKHTSIQVEYFNESLECPAHWIYYPNLNVPYHRKLLRNNFSAGSRGYWTETNGNRVQGNTENFTYFNEYAYPLNTIEKPMIMKNIIDYMSSYNIFPIGRWGEHQHYNSDVSVERALSFCSQL